ncbi:MAG: CcdB family protein, partial [Rhodocyclaceae bacterium]|nr:CcdB family protein [Rhodocyclaceae bacterium]
MSQFDVCNNPDPGSRIRIPFVVILQSDLLGSAENHVVAPLRPRQDASVIPVLHLNPVVEVHGAKYVIRVQDIAAVPRRLLKQPVANLAAQREEILAALDFL